MDNIEKIINSTNWYRQGGTLVHFYCSNAYRAAFTRYHGFNYFLGKNNYGYFDKNLEKIIAYNFVKKCVTKDNYLSVNYLKPWSALVKQRQVLVNKYKNKLSNLTNNQLEKFYKQVQRLDYKIWYIGIIIESLDPWGDTIISDYLSRAKVNLSLSDIATLTSPFKLSYVQKFKLDLLKSIKSKNNINYLLEKHYFINNSWAHVERLSMVQLNNELKLIGKISITRRLKWKRELQNYERLIKKQKKTLIKKYKLSKILVNLFALFSQIADWRDIRKEQTVRMNDFFFAYLNELSNRTKIPIKYLYNLDSLEAGSIQGIKKIKRFLIKRYSGLFYYINKGEFKYYTGKTAIYLHSKLQKALTKCKELKGVVASPGQITGIARIVIHKEDFAKIRLGNILITQMTRPEFAPVLNKVAGIVTDEGGVTCHAAIISRELGIPCVIGTQIATSVIKNGQKIILDANQGIIELL